MRCKKCGFTSFDWLNACASCGKPMETEKALIGDFFSDDKPIDWFSLFDNLSDIPLEKERVPEERVSRADSQKKDDSDFVGEGIDIEEEELKKLAQDQEFQEVLEEIST